MLNVYRYRGNQYIPHDCCAIAIVERKDGETDVYYLRTEREIALTNDLLLSAGHNPVIHRIVEMSQESREKYIDPKFVRDISKDWATNMSYEEAMIMLEKAD